MLLHELELILAALPAGALSSAPEVMRATFGHFCCNPRWLGAIRAEDASHVCSRRSPCSGSTGGEQLPCIRARVLGRLVASIDASKNFRVAQRALMVWRSDGVRSTDPPRLALLPSVASFQNGRARACMTPPTSDCRTLQVAGLLAEHATEVCTLFVPALLAVAAEHWNASVQKMAGTVLQVTMLIAAVGILHRDGSCE